MPKLESYSRKLEYSYALGVFPSLTLIKTRPEAVRRLLLHPSGLKNEGVAQLREACASLGIREEMAERVLARESRKENCFAALVFDKYECVLDENEPHVVFCQISDGGNLGTALRSLLGFGIHNAAIIRPAVDAFDPHVLRASMGAFYRMNVRVYDAFDQWREQYPNHALYPFMLEGSTTLEEAAREPKNPFALIFGNEQTGLPKEFASFGQPVRIPQSDEIDSLNLAVATAIGTYAFTRTLNKA